LLASDEAEQHIRCHLSYFNQRLVNSCQWWRHLGGIHHVVETDHAHLIGDANIALVEYLVDACCLCIVASEDRRRRIWLIEQETGLLDAVAKQMPVGAGVTTERRRSSGADTHALVDLEGAVDRVVRLLKRLQPKHPEDV